MKNIRIILLSLTVILITAGCVTTKKKNAEVGWLKKGYHNLTSKYNYWFNADELLTLTIKGLSAQHKDNYNQVLDLYPYAAVDPQSARGDLDNVIKKSSMAIALHRVGDFTDDCYTMIGQSQYLKQDYETAESTFRFIREEYNPNNKTKSTLKSSKEKKKDRAKRLKEKKKERKKKLKEKKKRKKQIARQKKRDKRKGIKRSKANKTEATKTSEKPAEEELVQQPDPYSKGLQRDAAYPKAMIWYGRTLTEREKYEEADFLFRDLSQDRFFPANLRKDLAVAETYLWLKQKRYEKAVFSLEQAIKYTRKKKARARLAYILSQLYERAGQYEKAYASLDVVLNSHPVYEMDFNARLRQIQAGWAHGKLASADANKSLERMTKDSKNAEYRDQIYFVMADIAIKDGLKPEAIGLLQQSLSYSQSNTNQRGESYLRLADLYFETEDFVFAKKYYDSTLTVLPALDERFPRVQKYAENLKDIARLITTIAQNDSIVKVFYMSDEERKDLAKTIKKQRDDDAQKAAELKADKPVASSKSLPIPIAGAKPSSFYFYNAAFLKKGKKDFSKAWGNRKLEDDWRRKNRPTSGGPSDIAETTDSLSANAISDSELTDIFQGIPRSEEELSVLHLSTYEAMYQLGVLFRDRLENNIRCTGTLEDMLTRYPDTLKYEKEAWYYCALAFNDLGNTERSKYYLDKLVNKYPTSAFARALTDPNFLNANKERERELNQYYEQTYSFFTKGDYASAFERCQEAPKKYGSTNPLIPKFALLSALCTGNLQGKEAYCEALKEVIARYPESSESTRAKEIARLLSCEGFEVTAASKNDAPAASNDFTLDDDKLHYFLIAISGDVRLDDVKIAVSDYNREYHRLDQLRISSIFLGTDTNMPILVIRKFDNREQVMRYYKEVVGRKEFLGETDKKQYTKEAFGITQENYRRILRNKSLDGYREFFNDNYLKN